MSQRKRTAPDRAPSPPPALPPAPAHADALYDSRNRPYAPSVGAFVVLVGSWLIAHVLAIRQKKGVRPPWTAEGLNAEPAYRLDVQHAAFEEWRARAIEALRTDPRWAAAIAHADAADENRHPPRSDKCVFCSKAAVPVSELDPPGTDAAAPFDVFRRSALPLPPLCEDHDAVGAPLLFAVCAPTMVWKLACALCARVPHVELPTLLPVAAASSERLADVARVVADFSASELHLPFMTVPVVWAGAPPAAPQ